METGLGRMLRRWAAVAALGLAAVGAAQAAVYVGRWDPPFGPPFMVADGARVDLGWSGEIVLDLPDACIAEAGDISNIAGDCGAAGGASVLSAFVLLYDVNDVADSTTLQFDPASFDIDLLRFADGQLSGLGMGPSSAVTSNYVSDAGFARDPITPVETLFALKFVLDLPLDIDPEGAQVTQDDIYSGPLLFWALRDNTCVPGQPCGTSDVARFPPQIVFRLAASQVPEPGTAVLALVALAAAGIVRRRRRG